ncbi:hypothetical protein T492DRAFT_893758, partial [Pavlovales sp. CCMP2436]
MDLTRARSAAYRKWHVDTLGQLKPTIDQLARPPGLSGLYAPPAAPPPTENLLPPTPSPLEVARKLRKKSVQRIIEVTQVHVSHAEGALEAAGGDVGNATTFLLDQAKQQEMLLLAAAKAVQQAVAQQTAAQQEAAKQQTAAQLAAAAKEKRTAKAAAETTALLRDAQLASVAKQEAANVAAKEAEEKAKAEVVEATTAMPKPTPATRSAAAAPDNHYLRIPGSVLHFDSPRPDDSPSRNWHMRACFGIAMGYPMTNTVRRRDVNCVAAYALLNGLTRAIALLAQATWVAPPDVQNQAHCQCPLSLSTGWLHNTPPWIVFAAMQRFHDALFLRLGLVVQPSKCECWSDEAHIASLDAHRGLVTRSHLLDGALTPHYGVMCYGVPIGSEEYARDACTRFDAIIHTQATRALRVSLDDDQLDTRRTRRMVDIAPAAFCGAMTQAVPNFLYIGQAFLCCWLEMQQEAGVGAGAMINADLPTCVLHLPPEEAWPMVRRDLTGKPSLNMQKDLTEDREAQRFDALKMRINALPRGDRSSAWVAALPIGYGACTIGEWVEITARFFGVPSPICVGLAACGARLFNRDIDVHGDNIVAATGQSVTGDHISKLRHDLLLALLAEVARRMGAHARTEAGDIFAPVLASNQAAYRLFFGGVGRRPGPTVDLYAEYDHKGGRA